jgi:Zn-dependent oligopeptidase
VAGAYRKEILSRVDEDEAMTLYTNFRGGMPATAPFLEDKGLK